MTPQTLLHTDREAFREIVALASEKFGFEQSHVEKDYWISKILRDIYDITVIYEKDEYTEFVHSEDFLNCMHKVTLEDEQYKNYPQNTTLAEAPIFKNAQEIMSLPKIMTAYNVDLKMLIFNNSNLPHIEEVVKTLALLYERLKGVE